MSDKATWSEDRCTCGHRQSEHANGASTCSACANDASWVTRNPAAACRRFQWNGQERKRTW